ncbi:MAG TPA: class F sortase [Streptomyces sp.]|nr:class F sortase [Streptomyces sp.]
MARPPERGGRPARRSRAYRLARTVVLTVLVVGTVRWAQDDRSATATAAPGPAATRAAGRDPARTAAPAPRADRSPSPHRARSGSPAAPRVSPGRPAATPRTPAVPRRLPPSHATRLRVPYVDVDAPVMRLGLDAGRRMTAPPDDDPNLVGWYRGGPAPGENGTAVAVGHLDTDDGPAVFAGLTELAPGHRVEVRRADDRTAVYTVDAVKSYEKDDFPDKEVYGSRGRPELRLITCGGTFDRRSGYSGNVVVFAHLTAVREPGRARTGA